jgi:hypothetical protein
MYKTIMYLYTREFEIEGRGRRRGRRKGVMGGEREGNKRGRRKGEEEEEMGWGGGGKNRKPFRNSPNPGKSGCADTKFVGLGSPVSSN